MNKIYALLITNLISLGLNWIIKRYFTNVEPVKVTSIVKQVVASGMVMAEEYRNAKADGVLSEEEKVSLFQNALVEVKKNIATAKLPAQTDEFLTTLIEGEVTLQKKE